MTYYEKQQALLSTCNEQPPVVHYRAWLARQPRRELWISLRAYLSTELRLLFDATASCVFVRDQQYLYTLGDPCAGSPVVDVESFYHYLMEEGLV